MAELPAPAEDDWNHEDELHEAQLQLLGQLEETMLERNEAEQRAQQAVWLEQQEQQRVQQAEQRARIHQVATRLLAAAPHGLDPALLPAWQTADTTTERVRVVVDQIASMTESRLERLADQVQ